MKGLFGKYVFDNILGYIMVDEVRLEHEFIL